MTVEPGQRGLARFALVVAAALCCLAAAPRAQAQPGPCISIPPPPDSLNLPRKYAAGLSQSEIDTDAAAVYAQGREPLVAARNQLNRLTEQVMSSSAMAGAPARRAAARCLMQNLAGFAQAGSLLGEMSPQAKDLRMFFLPTAAIGFIAARDQFSDPPREARIEAWLAAISADSIKREDKRAAIGNSTAKPYQVNNHYYWTGYGALLVGIATQDGDAYDWGARAIARGLDEVDADGLLAPEMARDSRALSYHALALQPLAMGALLLREAGQPPSGRQMNALKRLGDRTAQGVMAPTAFAQLTAARNGGRVIAQVEVPKTPPAVPVLMSLFGASASLSAVDAQVRCYPNGAIGPSVGVWLGRTPASDAFAWPATAPPRFQRLASPPTGYKVCVR